MRSPAISVGWELWHRNRLGSVLILSVIPLCYLVRSLPASRQIHETLSAFEMIGMLLAITAIFWIHSLVENDKQGNHAGFPSRLFIVPLRTAALVTFPMLFGIVAIVAFYFAWSRLIFPQWGVDLPWHWLRCQLLTLAAMMASLQAIIWSFHRFPWIRFVLLATVSIGLGAFGILMPANEFPGLGQSGTIACLASILIAAYVGAILGVERDRHGQWAGWTGRLLQRLLDSLPRRRRDFRSAFQAQLWFEWRRKGVFLACLFAVPPAATVLTFPVPSALYLDGVQALLTYSALPIMVAIMSSAFGLGVAKSDFWCRDPALHPFLAIRPVSTGDLVMAKMKVAAWIVIGGGLFFCILAIPAFHVPRWLAGEDGNFPSWSRFKAENAVLIDWASHPMTLLTAFALTWQAMIEGVSIGLTGRPRTILWRSIRSVAIIFLLVGSAGWLIQRPGHFAKWMPVWPWLAAAVLVFKVTSTVCAMHAARSRQLFSRHQLGGLTLIWIGIAGCVVTSAFLLSSLNLPRELLFLGVAWLFPDGSLARCALNLASNRHR